MDNIALVNINSSNTRKDLFIYLNFKHFKIIEVSSIEDLENKYNKYKENIMIYVQEFDELDKEKSFEYFKVIDTQETASVILIHELHSDVIEEASLQGVKDVIKIPVDLKTLDERLTPYISEDVIKASRKRKKKERERVKFDFKVFDDEIRRSKRGNYPVMVVVITHNKIFDNKENKILEILGEHLRTTDVVEVYDSETIILYCPFTPKENYSIVKEKITEAFANIDSDKKKNKINVTGLVFPDDFENEGDTRDVAKKAVETLIDEIEDNRLFFQIENPDKNIDLKTIRSRLRRNFISY